MHIYIVYIYMYVYIYIYTLFGTEVTYMQILFFKVLINLSTTTDFPSLCVEYISISLSCNHDFIDLL